MTTTTYHGSLDGSVLWPEYPTYPSPTRHNPHMSHRDAGLFEGARSPSTTSVHWQCHGCGQSFGSTTTPLPPAGTPYGDVKHQPSVISAWPDGRYRTFCRSCCRGCAACKTTVFHRQWHPATQQCWGCALRLSSVAAVAVVDRKSRKPAQASLGQFFKAAAAAPAIAPAVTGAARATAKPIRLLITGDGSGSRMDSYLYHDARQIVLTIVTKRLGLDPAKVTLVGAGGIWCDYLSTDLYASAGFKALEVYQPPDAYHGAVEFFAKAFRSGKGHTLKKEGVFVNRGFTSDKQRLQMMTKACDHMIGLSWAKDGVDGKFVQLPAWQAWHASNPSLPLSRAIHLSLEAVQKSPRDVEARFFPGSAPAAQAQPAAAPTTTTVTTAAPSKSSTR